MSAAAAGLYGLGVVVLFGLRIWQHQRATGSYGFNGFNASRAPAALVAGLCFAAAVLVGLISPILTALGVLPLLTTGRDVSTVVSVVVGLGTLLALAGLGLGVVAQQAMGRSWRIGVDPTETTELVTDGPFRLIRNPIFTAMMMIQIGTATMAVTWLSLVGVAMMITACQIQTRLVEEPYLRRRHTTYPDYAATVGRFVPGLGRLQPAPLSSHAAGGPA